MLLVDVNCDASADGKIKKKMHSATASSQSYEACIHGAVAEDALSDTTAYMAWIRLYAQTRRRVKRHDSRMYKDTVFRFFKTRIAAVYGNSVVSYEL